MEIVALIAAVLIVFGVWAIVEHSAVELGRSSDAGAEWRRFKRHWQILGLLIGGGTVLAVLWAVSVKAALITLGGLFLAYTVFRYVVQGNPLLQRYFLVPAAKHGASTDRPEKA